MINLHASYGHPSDAVTDFRGWFFASFFRTFPFTEKLCPSIFAGQSRCALRRAAVCSRQHSVVCRSYPASCSCTQGAQSPL